jgi:hypothetical protein
MPRGAPASHTVPSVVILGADAVFAALPATPVQLAHACQRLGFASAFPASWGDELIAGACLRELAERGADPAILCSCPRVRERLLRAGDDLAPWMISLVSPPVAVARYLRAAYGARVLHITFVGACPGAADSVIDERLTPADFLALCRERGVSPAAQPQLFESVLPPDRRRSLSMPGGAPSDDAMREHGGGRILAELSAEDALGELADRLIAHERVLLDLAPHIGCACSAIGDAVGGRDERRELIALEPPRSREPVLDPTVQVDLDVPLPRGSPRPVPRAAAPLITHAHAPLRIPPLPPLEPVHAFIREFPHGGAARRAIAMMRRRAAADTPSAALESGTVPRAYLAKRKRARPVRRALTAAARDSRVSRDDRERRIDLASEVGDARRSRRTPRSVVIPLATEPPSPVPPPPAKRKPGTVLGISTIIAITLAVGSTGGFPR